MRRQATVMVLGLAVLCAAPALASPADRGAIRFDAASWELSGDAAVATSTEGEALTISSGEAVHRDAELADGTIEFDVEVTEYRSFVYVSFRRRQGGEYEEIYFRPHKSRLPDAIQYTPAYKGRGQWQLFHDGRSTAAAPLPPSEPIHVKVVLEGRLGVVYVGDATEPRLRFHLAHAPAAGRVGLRCFRPRGVPEDVTLARFTNLSIRPGEVEPSPPFVAEAFEPPAGRVDRWLVSPAFEPPEGAVRRLPAEILESPGWRAAPVTPVGGFVEIERHVSRPEGARRAAVLARLEVVAKEAVDRRLFLGFSDEISVFLNGRLIASADDSYSFNEPRRQGLLTPEQLAVYLPLEKGENELVVAVSDRFGGWGLAGRFEDTEGLAIQAR